MSARALRIPAILSAAALSVLAVASLAAAAAGGGAPKTAGPHFVRVSAIRVRPKPDTTVSLFDVMARRDGRPFHLVVAAPVAVVRVAPAATGAIAATAATAATGAAPPRGPAPVAPAPQVAGQEALLTIPSLGIRLPIVLGGQATIDRGVVTHYQANGWRPPVAAGAPGTYWLAAHHSTHGSPFAALPGIRAGAIVIIDPVSGPEIRYQVTSTEVVGTTASNLTVYGADATSARILLQTCEGGAYRLLVHGIRIS